MSRSRAFLDVSNKEMAEATRAPVGGTFSIKDLWRRCRRAASGMGIGTVHPALLRASRTAENLACDGARLALALRLPSRSASAARRPKSGDG